MKAQSRITWLKNYAKKFTTKKDDDEDKIQRKDKTAMAQKLSQDLLDREF